MEQLLTYDKYLFKLINNGLSNSFFDWLMPWLRNSVMWTPFYLFIILFGAINFKKNGWWWIVFAICTAIITDFVSSGLIKNNIIRLRPCNDPSLASYVKVLVRYRPQSSSFTSSHAANHFGVAMYLYITLKPYIAKWGMLFFLWAFSISFAQIYVGVHFPLDIFCGGAVGMLIGYFCAKKFNNNYSLN
ncbi:MAG: phosphatase PAP2 family protein [Ferruginibacter sp.]|nr:phosphatase PAP2 family protein [Ferruginibacter sp.]